MSPTPTPSSRKGILMAGGAGSRHAPLTVAVSKQLLPVYDKPMVYYSLSVLMEAGVREILLIASPDDLPAYRRLLGDGADFGLALSYEAQPQPGGPAQALQIGAAFVGTSPSCLVLGDNLFHGPAFIQALRGAAAQTEGATVFAQRVAEPRQHSVVEIDPLNRPLSIEEKPERPKSFWAVPGVYFYDGRAVEYAFRITPSLSGELEITDLNRIYLESGKLRVERLSRDTTWLDTGTPETLLEAANYVRAIQSRMGIKLACPEEIAFRRGWIGAVDIVRRAEALHRNSPYGDYLRIVAATRPEPSDG